jgi:hypothetical protein
MGHEIREDGGRCWKWQNSNRSGLIDGLDDKSVEFMGLEDVTELGTDKFKCTDFIFRC